MIKYFIIFIINFCFLFNLKAEILPDWYKDTKNTKLYIYGLGKGENLDNAIKAALDNVKEKFLKKNEDYKININLLNFSNYEIEKKEKIDDIYYILLTIRRSELYNLQLQQLNEIVLDIENLYNFLDKKNDFVKFTKFEEILKLVNEMNNKIEIIKLIDNKFNYNRYNLLYKKVENKYINLLNNLDIKIEIEQKRIKPLLKFVMHNIRKNNFVRINDKSKNTLRLYYKIKMLNVENNYNVDILFYVKILDKDDNLVNYNSFNYSFSSTNSFADAIDAIINEFKKDLKSGKIKIIDFALKNKKY